MNPANPAIYVVVTTYNLENYIEECIKELLLQTFKNFNILIIDDASTDNTQNIVLRFAHLYKDRIKYTFLSKNTGSPSFTRNVALDCGLIDSKYIIFLDGDDSIESTFLEKLYNDIEYNGSDISICAFNRIDDITNHKYSTEMRGFNENVINIPFDDYRLSFINTSLWNKLIKCSVIGPLRFKDLRGPEDTLFIMELYTKIKRISFIRDVLIHYKVRAGSVVNASNDTIKKFACYLFSIKGLYEKEDNKIMLDAFILSVFIHLGISMSFRIYSNRKWEIDEHINWTINILDKNFCKWRGNKYLSVFYAFSHFNIKLLSLSVCRFLYKIKMFKLFLIVYHSLINKLGIDIKW